MKPSQGHPFLPLTSKYYDVPCPVSTASAPPTPAATRLAAVYKKTFDIDNSPGGGILAPAFSPISFEPMGSSRATAQ